MKKRRFFHQTNNLNLFESGYISNSYTFIVIVLQQKNTFF